MQIHSAPCSFRAKITTYTVSFRYPTDYVIDCKVISEKGDIVETFLFHDNGNKKIFLKSVYWFEFSLMILNAHRTAHGLRMYNNRKKKILKTSFNSKNISFLLLTRI